MNVLCVIPARSGSLRVEAKNLQHIDGTNDTLIDLAAKVALEVTPHVFTSSDYGNSFLPQNCGHIRGNDELYGPRSDIAAVAAHALRTVEAGRKYDYVITLQPATPLRSARLIREMLETMHRARCKAALTMSRCVPWTWRIENGNAINAWTPNPYPRSADVRFHNLQEINTVQIASREVVLSGQRWATPLLVAELPHWAVLDIDTPEELAEVRRLWPALKPAFDEIPSFPFHVAHTVNGEAVCA